MDPFSQGVLGASLPQAVSPARYNRLSVVIGFLAGLLADADILIQSTEDPLIYLEYHRQFTHSLIFIPVGGLILSFLLYFFVKNKISFRRLYIYATLGYGTHGVLDACTTYGTQLLWPFSNVRVAWNYISIIDPLFTLPLALMVLLGFIFRKRGWAIAGLLWAIFYMGLGAIQHQRALEQAHRIASSRGHRPVRVDAKPSFANIILWKTVYETEDYFFVDAVRIFKTGQIFQGERIEKFKLERDFPLLDPESQQAKDIERFRWFSNGYIAVAPERSNVVGDVRYSMIPNEIEPLWGIIINADTPDEHVQFESFRNIEGRHRFLEMLDIEMLGVERFFQKPKVDSKKRN